MESSIFDKKHCIYCGEQINADWRRCPFCGSLIGNNIRKIESTVQTAPPEEVEEKFIKQSEQEMTHIQSDEPKIQRNKYEREKKPLSNAMKVFITTISAVIPGLGQLAGLIMSIVFMNSEDDADKRSFGAALLVTSLIIFIFSCLCCSILILAFAASVSQ